MPDDACPLTPTPLTGEQTAIRRMLEARRVAVVGMSDDPSRPSHYVGAYLIDRGYDVIPVNPNIAEVLGRRAYPTLSAIPGGVDLVNVFRRGEVCAAIVREALAIKAKGVWLQSGVTNSAGRALAMQAGILYVENRCIMVEHTRLAR